jgi:Carboxypeptidase regulatory-like domain
MQFRSWRIAGLALVLAVGLAHTADAQEQTGTITGRATDTSGAALPGTTVSVTSPNLIGGARTAVTDAQGIYRMTLLPGGI